MTERAAQCRWHVIKSTAVEHVQMKYLTMTDGKLVSRCTKTFTIAQTHKLSLSPLSLSLPLSLSRTNTDTPAYTHARHTHTHVHVHKQSRVILRHTFADRVLDFIVVRLVLNGTNRRAAKTVNARKKNPQTIMFWHLHSTLVTKGRGMKTKVKGDLSLPASQQPFKRTLCRRTTFGMGKKTLFRQSSSLK